MSLASLDWLNECSIFATARTPPAAFDHIAFDLGDERPSPLPSGSSSASPSSSPSPSAEGEACETSREIGNAFSSAVVPGPVDAIAST